MGVVYEAEHTETRKRVALKLLSLEPHADLPQELQSTAPTRDAIVRFQREARAAGSIDTPHVVEVFDAGTDDESGRPYLAMELLRGEPLDALLERVGMLPPDVAVRIAAQACKGLVEAHAAGVVHRDIKPGNLFLARDEGRVVVKILDFGIAKITEGAVISSGARDLTTTGSLLGSPRYMAPEQVKGLRTVDHRADLWALGVVLYRMLAGRTPHRAEAPGELLLAVCTQRPDPLQDHAPWIEPALARVVDGALQPSVSRRYADAAAMLAALHEVVADDALREEELVPLADSARARVAPRMALRDPDDERTLRDRPTMGRRRPLLYLLGGALVAGAAFVGWRARSSAELAPTPGAPPVVPAATADATVRPPVPSTPTTAVVAPPSSSSSRPAPRETAARPAAPPKPSSTARSDELDVSTSLE